MNGRSLVEKGAGKLYLCIVYKKYGHVYMMYWAQYTAVYFIRVHTTQGHQTRCRVRHGVV